ncbi:MAG: acyl phosphate:glycerol-3-phosphate acyltransferase [Actinomycetota bacterium]|jgi:glycerol-3-phosphate acyltransferase PlsY|nr:acyl phosphate:glycerol-3-phosphate acyltransferase [Actinomycetota bacterium]
MPGSWIVVAVAAVLGFFFGSVNPATIVARVRHADLRQGSGNPGATNVGRVLGTRWGVAVGLLDVLKGLLPTLLTLLLFDRVTAYLVGFATVLGHVVSPFLRGRGGKGVATSLGATLAVFPWFALGMLVVFGLMLWRTRWVAGSSLVAAVLLALYAGLAPLPSPVAAGRIWGICVALLVILRHHGNIRRWVRRRFA